MYVPQPRAVLRARRAELAEPREMERGVVELPDVPRVLLAQPRGRVKGEDSAALVVKGCIISRKQKACSCTS